MEKKTIGEFISVLRKANGLTQRQLAEMLQVSDKSVSRWERNETAPDLSLIPIIAEIFGITADELLRGERKAPGVENRGEVTRFTLRGEKRLQHILAGIKTKYGIRSAVAAAIAVFGVIAAIGCAELFRRSSDGFVVGLIVILAAYFAAVLCQVINVVTAFASVNSDEFDGKLTDALKRKFIKVAVYIIGGLGVLSVVGIVSICGFELFEWVPLVLFWGAAVAVAYVILWQIVKNLLIRRGCTCLKGE